jgi:hypothetical protein
MWLLHIIQVAYPLAGPQAIYSTGFAGPMAAEHIKNS